MPIEFRKLLVYNLPFIKGIGILGVILIHTTSEFSMMTDFGWLFHILIFLNNLARFAVPLFIILSGFYLSLNPRNEKAIPFYRRTIKFLLVPFFLYSLFYSILNLRAGTNIWQVVLDIPLASAAGHLWFGLLILQLYLLHPVLRRWYLSCKYPGKLVLISFAFQIIWHVLTITVLPKILSDFSMILFSNSDILARNYNDIILRITKLLFFGNIGYFLLGYYIHDQSKSIFEFIKKPGVFFLALLTWLSTATFLAGYWGNQLFKGVKWNEIENRDIFHYFLIPFLSIAALITILCSFKNDKKSIDYKNLKIQSLGLYSYGIYYLHIFFIMIFNAGFRYFINPYPLDMVSYYFLQFILVSFITLQTVKILARTKFGRYLT